MNVELTVQSMYDNYPVIFQDRFDCYNHLFCVIGNGFEWVDGELVDGCVVQNLTKHSNNLVDGKAHQHITPEFEFPRKPRRERWYFRYPDGEIHYGKDFAYLFNYPEDIKPDWLDALNECKAMLVEDGYDI